MNILFISDNQPIPTFGGIERVICNLTKAFSNVGIECYSAFFHKIDGTYKESFFEQYELSADNFLDKLSSIIRNKHIQIVLNCVIVKNNIRETLLSFNELKKSNPTTHFVYCFHNYPGYEQRTLPVMYIIMRMLHSQRSCLNDFPLLCRSLSNKLLPGFTRRLLNKKYHIITNNTDNLVLLSESYKKDLANLVGIDIVPTEWMSIGNPLTFSEKINVDVLHKEKIVLIVSRLEEDQKRISIALKIWNELCSKYDVSDWNLIIVGDGVDRPIYERTVQKRKIPNVIFEGRRPSLSYYLRSSIFMMTSAYEGFPMTLLETMQCGCPPIAFDTFSAINDLIDNGGNGVVVNNGDVRRYVEELHLLMRDDALRNSMALRGMQSVQQFSIDNIVKVWYNYFEKLSTENKAQSVFASH